MTPPAHRTTQKCLNLNPLPRSRARLQGKRGHERGHDAVRARAQHQRRAPVLGRLLEVHDHQLAACMLVTLLTKRR